MSDVLLNFLADFENANWQYNTSIMVYEGGPEYDYVLNLTRFYEEGERVESMDWAPILRHADEFEKFDPQTYVNSDYPYGLDVERDEFGSHTVEVMVKE